jgi:hypothetical protein
MTRGCRRACALILLPWLSSGAAFAQATPAEVEEDAAVGQSINYVFATELGSGVYDLDGRTLQIYRYTHRRDLRAVDEDTMGVRFVLPVTAGFFDFDPVDVLSEGPPTRIDSLGLVPGLELDYLLRGDWHLIPYARAGFSVASSSVDGLLYGAGVRLERRGDWFGWDQLLREELSFAAVNYRHEVASDRFVRLRHGVDIRRGLGWSMRGRELDLGLYGLVDLVLDPPTIPVAGARDAPIEMEVGFTLGTRPQVKVWKLTMPRIGIGFRSVGRINALRVTIGAPF